MDLRSTAELDSFRTEARDGSSCALDGEFRVVHGRGGPGDEHTLFDERHTWERAGQDEPWVEARGLFPFAGITEDPATGSAAGPLAAYMAREGVLAPDEERVVLQGQQIGRPSFLTVAVSGTPTAITDVRVGGSVRSVLRGELSLPD